MKVHFEIDCTPIEAREFFGLPDVRGLHAEVTKRLEERLLSNVDALSPQEMLHNWFGFNASGVKQAQDLFTRALGLGAMPFAREDADKKP
jgi:hypothetical protein